MTGDLTYIQHLLIKASLSDTAAEQQRWVSEWEEKVVIDDLDYSVSKLIPYFFYRNQQAGITTRYDKRLKVVYKHWWLKAQHITDQLNKVQSAFKAAGIGYVVIKGAATRSYYPLHELRPMADFDLLVRPADLDRALQVLKGIGYAPHQVTGAQLQQAPGMMIDFMHGIECAHQVVDAYVDVHWRVGSFCTMDFTEKLWKNLEEYESFPGGKKPALAYEVFMILMHAAMHKDGDGLSWIIDIAILNARTDGSFWPAVEKLAVEEKKKSRFDYACAILLEYGVYAPEPSRPVSAPALTMITPEKRQAMTRIGLYRTQLTNLAFHVNNLFPHANPLTLLYQYLRRIRFHFFLERFSYIEDEPIVK